MLKEYFINQSKNKNVVIFVRGSRLKEIDGLRRVENLTPEMKIDTIFQGKFTKQEMCVLSSAVKQEKIRPVVEVGSGRFTSYSEDHEVKYCEILETWNFDYEIGNDSPKGGKLGNYIIVKK